MHGVLHLTAEPEAGGEVGRDLTVCRHRLVRHWGALGGEGGQPGEPGGEAGIQRRPAHGPGGQAVGTMRVDQVQAEPGNPLFIGDERGQHRAAGAASHVLEQGPEEDGLHAVGP
jgi:hypothetical protein